MFKPKVLAIDPGTQHTGFAIFDANGVLIEHGRFNCEGSVQLLVTQLSPYVINHNGINKIVIEGQYLSAPGERKVNVKSAGMVKFVAGAIAGAVLAMVNSLRMSGAMDVEVVSVMPRSWQSKIVPRPKGVKCTKAMIREVAAEYAGERTLNDESDAICIGQWYFKHGRFKH